MKKTYENKKPLTKEEELLKQHEIHNFAVTRNIQIARIQNVLQIYLERMRLALLVPTLCQIVRKMPALLRGTEYEATAVPLFKEYAVRRSVIWQSYLTKNRLDKFALDFIDYLMEHPQLIEHIPNYINYYTREEKRALNVLDTMYNIAEYHTQKTAIVKIQNEIDFYYVYQHNAELHNTIKELKAKLVKQSIQLRWKSAIKEVYLRQWEEAAQQFKVEANEKMESLWMKLLDDINREGRAGWDKVKEVKMQLEEQTALKNKAAIPLNEISAARAAARTRSLLRHLALVKKYDTVVGEKRKILFQMQCEFDKMKKEYSSFMRSFGKKYRLYLKISKLREERTKRKEQRRIILFRINLAARKIQRYWRAYRKRTQKWAKKMAKKEGKGKKKK